MKYTNRAILMIGVATGALALGDNGLYAQSADLNAAPNPYKMQESVNLHSTQCLLRKRHADILSADCAAPSSLQGVHSAVGIG